MRRVLFLGLVLCLPAGARADEVYTRSGGHLTGEIVERGPQSLVVDIGIGRIELPLSYVDRIVPGEAPITVYRRRAQELPADDVSGWLSLGRWARENDLGAQSAEAFEHVVSHDPDNAAAQKALGRVNVGGTWMTIEESYEARGLVRFDGRWVSPDERDAALAERAEASRRAREASDEQARVRETEARLRAAEAEARIVEAQARAQEAQARAAEIQAAAFPLPVLPGYATPYAAPFYAPAVPVVADAPPLCDRTAFGVRGRGRRQGSLRPVALPREWSGRMSATMSPLRRGSRTASCSR
jgi:hypothetical protein